MYLSEIAVAGFDLYFIVFKVAGGYIAEVNDRFEVGNESAVANTDVTENHYPSKVLYIDFFIAPGSGDPYFTFRNIIWPGFRSHTIDGKKYNAIEPVICHSVK